ncbi:unnamed protein product [Lactuca saligna]|uniref:Uncharacterized protein n=1 Tax=Lactuca saligna TaxID=75948 RepID=A0AA35ZJX6_LACSI|nr:unnamed protein product [Lactuca saligna]
MFPTCTTKENTFKETPNKVFRREHENLVKEAEKWMKAIALITTNRVCRSHYSTRRKQSRNRHPHVLKKIAFTIFAISDAISLFASSSTLLMFSSIVTGSFDKKDFLFICEDD